MRFRIGAVGGKIGGHCVELVLKAIHAFVQSCFNPVDLFRKHLETLADKRKLFLKAFPLDSQLMLKFFFDFIFEFS